MQRVHVHNYLLHVSPALVDLTAGGCCSGYSRPELAWCSQERRETGMGFTDCVLGFVLSTALFIYGSPSHDDIGLKVQLMKVEMLSKETIKNKTYILFHMSKQILMATGKLVTGKNLWTSQGLSCV